MAWKSFRFFNKRPSDQFLRQVSDFVHRRFGFYPRDTESFRLAFTHRSAGEPGKHGLRESNERLEFLGDAIIDSVVADFLYHQYPSLPEGDLTKMKAKVVSRRSLNALGEEFGIGECLKKNLGRQEMHRSMLGNAFEALIGAVYLEKGYDFTYKALLKIISDRGLDQLVHEETDYKSKLHEYCQKKKVGLQYKVLNEEQSNGKSSYTVQVMVGNKPMGTGIGKSKKHAEQEASRKACRTIFKRES